MIGKLWHTATCALLLVLAKALLSSASLDSTKRMLRRCARVLHARAQPATVARTINRAARRLPWQVTCLHEALVGEALLRNAGVGCELRIGARRTEGVHHFHAWLDHEGTVIIGVTDQHHSILLSQ